MKEYVGKDDLPMINFILERGGDVRIRKSDKAVSILSEDAKVMNKKKLEDLPEQ